MTTPCTNRILVTLSAALVLLATVPGGLSARQGDAVAVTPRPVSLQKTDGEFRLPDHLTLGVPARETAKPVAAYLQSRLQAATGFAVAIAPDVAYHGRCT